MNLSRGKRISGRVAGKRGILGVWGRFFILLFISCFWAEYTRAQLTCDIVQVTDTAAEDSEASFLNADGTLGAFSSEADINGGNPDGSFEAYTFDVDTLEITQLTDSVGLNSFIFDINDDGTLLALSSEADLTGGNADGNREIFLFDRSSETFTQITDTTGEDNIVARLNGDGTLLVFDSSADVTGGNADENREIFLFDTETDMFTQLTDTTAGNNLVPVLTPDGAVIAFHSSADITGDNPDPSLEVFLFDVGSTTFTQLTDGGVGVNSASPSLSDDVSLVAMNSDTDPTGLNPDGNREILLFDTGTMTFTQITNSLAGSSSDPSLDSDGSHLVFSSQADPTGENPDGNLEVFIFNTDTMSFTQVTDTLGGTNRNARKNGDNMTILIESSSNIGGGNPDGNQEIYFAGCRIVVVQGDGSGGGGGCAIADKSGNESNRANTVLLLLPLLMIGLRLIILRERQQA